MKSFYTLPLYVLVSQAVAGRLYSQDFPRDVNDDPPATVTKTWLTYFPRITAWTTNTITVYPHQVTSYSVLPCTTHVWPYRMATEASKPEIIGSEQELSKDGSGIQALLEPIPSPLNIIEATKVQLPPHVPSPRMTEPVTVTVTSYIPGPTFHFTTQHAVSNMGDHTTTWTVCSASVATSYITDATITVTTMIYTRNQSVVITTTGICAGVGGFPWDTANVHQPTQTSLLNMVDETELPSPQSDLRTNIDLDIDPTSTTTTSSSSTTTTSTSTWSYTPGIVVTVTQHTTHTIGVSTTTYLSFTDTLTYKVCSTMSCDTTVYQYSPAYRWPSTTSITSFASCTSGTPILPTHITQPLAEVIAKNIAARQTSSSPTSSTTHCATLTLSTWTLISYETPSTVYVIKCSPTPVV